jgi:hypothetical protein
MKATVYIINTSVTVRDCEWEMQEVHVPFHTPDMGDSLYPDPQRTSLRSPVCTSKASMEEAARGALQLRCR